MDKNNKTINLKEIKVNVELDISVEKDNMNIKNEIINKRKIRK